MKKVVVDENTTKVAVIEPKVEVKPAPLYAHFRANDTLGNADPEDKREACVQFAVDFAVSRGCSVEDAGKLRTALIGTVQKDGSISPGSLSLVSWEVYIADVSAIIREKDQIWQAMSGYLTVPSRGNTKATYNINLRPHTKEDPQKTFAIAIQKKGSANYDSNNKLVAQDFFWTYAGVVLQTEARKVWGKDGEEVEIPGMPMTLGYNITARDGANGEGKTLSGRWSPRLYLYEDENGQTASRLDTISRGPNDEQRFLEALIFSGFPVHETKVRPSATTNRGSWTPSPRRQPVAASKSSFPSIKGDLFDDGE